MLISLGIMVLGFMTDPYPRAMGQIGTNSVWSQKGVLTPCNGYPVCLILASPNTGVWGMVKEGTRGYEAVK